MTCSCPFPVFCLLKRGRGYNVVEATFFLETAKAEPERTPDMSEKMVTPELFRPPVDFPDIPYDHLLRNAAARTPDRPAIIFHDLVLTYREVVSMVNCIANGLYNLGMRKGDRICLFTTNRPEYTI